VSGTAAEPNPTQRVTVKVEGGVFSTWTKVKIVRNLHEVCGSFELECRDTARESGAYANMPDPVAFQALKGGQKVQLLIDGELVLQGWLEKPKFKQGGRQISVSIAGRDVCGDLVDCCVPLAPSDYANISLQTFAEKLCAPMKIGVVAQTNVGANLAKLAVKPHEKILAAIEKAARQRSVLVCSDGIANLLLTTAGNTRAPATISVGDNVIDAEYEEDWSRRFSDIFVRGQTAHANGNHAVPSALTPATAPGVDAPDTSITTAETQGIVMTGHAQDTDVTRYRPDCRMVPTQSGSSSVQQLAEWYVRVDRGQARRGTYTVEDWRAGDSRARWLPNTLAAIYDPFAGLDEDMLIAGVTYLYDEGGARTEISIVGPTAYDRVNQPARVLSRHKMRQ
jgi:prophage tail gpP-like protein